jgi:hypothetical protein
LTRLLPLLLLLAGCASTPEVTDTTWAVPWAMYVWGGLFAAVLVFEIYTLFWNKQHKGKRANLTAFVRAAFGVGKRRLKYQLPKWLMVVFLAWLLLHFLEVIP